MRKKIIDFHEITEISYDGFCYVLAVSLCGATANDPRATYRFAEVPKNVYQNFLRCKFKIKFISEKIANEYRSQKVNSDLGLVESLIREIDNR